MADEISSIGLGTLAAGAPAVPAAARRLIAGTALSLLFGAAFGARHGWVAAAASALAAPLALLALVTLAAPMLYIAMAHAGADIAASEVGGATADGVETSGRVLAGLSPGMLLVSSSAESDLVAVALYVVGFFLAIWLGLRCLRAGLVATLGSNRRFASLVVVYTFTGFCWLLAGRVWWAASPLLNGQVSP